MKPSLRWLLGCALCTIACHRSSPRPDADAAQAATAQSDASLSDDPLEGLMGPPGMPAYKKTADDAFTVFDPTYATVGEPFALNGQMDADCAPRGAWDPPIATLIGGEVFTPKFPTPIRSFRGHFRASMKGTGSIVMKCTRGSTRRSIIERTLTILDPSEAAPFVDIELSMYAGDLALALETGRVGALACFVTDLARQPKTRGLGQMQVWIDGHGGLSVPADRPDFMGHFDGISATAGDCVRKSITEAVAAQKRADTSTAKYPNDRPWKDRGSSADLRFRFEMRPKATDATACARYAARWKACTSVRESSRFIDPHDAIVARTKVVKTEEARGALSFACSAALQDLASECR